MDVITRKINILLNVETNFLPKAEYVFRTFCKIRGLQPEFFYGYTLEDINIYYGTPSATRYPVEIYHDPHTAQFFSKNNLYDKDSVHFVKYRNEHIPFLFSQRGVLFHQTRSALKIRKDIIASAFFFLSCWEEYVYTQREQANHHSDSHHYVNAKDTADQQEHHYHGKDKLLNSSKNKPFPSVGNKFLAKIWDFYMIPVVDRYSDIFQKSIEIALPGYQKVNRWLEEDNFAISVSHVITDNLRNNVNRLHKVLLYEEKKGIISNILFPISLTEGSDAAQIERIVKSYKTLLWQTKAKNNKNSTSAEHSTAKTQGIFSDNIVNSASINNSCEVYGNYGLKIDGFCLFGLRKHYSSLFNQLDNSVISYDMSLFTQLNFGYRAGISFPFHPFNIEANKPFNVLEVPPSIALLRDFYCPSNYLSYLLHETCRHSSVLSIISDGSKKSVKQFYKILSYSIKREGLATSPDMIADKWLTL